MVVSQHDEACLVERAGELGELLGIIRLRLIGTEGIVGRLVQSGIDHHAAIGIDDLERGAGHRHRAIIAAFDDEFAWPDAGRHARTVDRKRQRAGKRRTHRSDGGKLGVKAAC